MKTVLLAWELGGGMGHVTTLRRLANHLRPFALRRVAVLKNVEAGHLLRSDGVEIVQAPLWPSASMAPAEIAKTSSASMGDILATAGLADAKGLRRLLGEWDEVFLRIKPDLVIANLAPAAALAARGRIPLMLVGDGFAMPPAEMKQFPPLHALSQPGDERLSLALVNDILTARHQKPLGHLPQVFSGDARMVLTVPLLDPYAAQRVERLHGPILDNTSQGEVAEPRSIFVYFSRGYPLHRDIPGALLAHAPRLRIHAPALSLEQARALTQAGAIVDHEPVRPARALASAALVVHLGGSGLAAEALLAGVPQLVLGLQIEQMLTGSALQRAGLGRVVAAYDPRSRPSADLDDATIAEAAAKAGRAHRALLRQTDLLTEFESICRRLLGTI